MHAPESEIDTLHVAGAEEEILQPLEEHVVAAVQLERAQEPSSLFVTRRRRLGLLLLLHLQLDRPRRGAGAGALDDDVARRRRFARVLMVRRGRRRRRHVLGGRRGAGAGAGAVGRGLPGEPLDELAEVPGLRLDDLRRQDVDDPDLPRRRRRLGDGVGEPPVRGRRGRRRR